MKLIMQMNNVWKTEHDRSIKGIEYNKEHYIIFTRGEDYVK